MSFDKSEAEKRRSGELPAQTSEDISDGTNDSEPGGIPDGIPDDWPTGIPPTITTDESSIR